MWRVLYGLAIGMLGTVVPAAADTQVKNFDAVINTQPSIAETT